MRFKRVALAGAVVVTSLLGVTPQAQASRPSHGGSNFELYTQELACQNYNYNHNVHFSITWEVHPNRKLVRPVYFWGDEDFEKDTQAIGTAFFYVHGRTMIPYSNDIVWRPAGFLIRREAYRNTLPKKTQKILLPWRKVKDAPRFQIKYVNYNNKTGGSHPEDGCYTSGVFHP